METFEEALSQVTDIEGWLTDGQARLLWDSASSLHRGDRVVEIGSFQGRSTVVLASAAPDGCELIAVDPHAGTDRGPEEYQGKELEAERDRLAFEGNLDAAGVADRVTYLRRWSHDALAEIEGPIALLYIDGAHRYQPARDDIRGYGERVALGGTLLIHDSFSSVGVTGAILAVLTFSSRWRYIGRSESMTEFRRSPIPLVERPANVARQLAQLPWFARNLLFKAMILAGLGRYVPRLGGTGQWPY